MTHIAKTALLEIHRRLTVPWRAWMADRWMRQGRMPIVVLYYHRVADTQPVPWSLTNDQFAAHVDWLQRHFEMISLERGLPTGRRGTRFPPGRSHHVRRRLRGKLRPCLGAVDRAAINSRG